MGALRPFVTGLILLVLFSLASFIFMESFILSNNPDSAILNKPELNASKARLNNSLAAFEEDARNLQNRFDEDKPSATTFLFLIFESAYSLPKAIFRIVINGMSLFTSFVFVQLFGTSPVFFIIFAAINTIIVISVLLYIIKTIRTGESER